MQCTIKKILQHCIVLTETDILRIRKIVRIKRRKISKRREVLRKELDNHVKMMRGEAKRIRNYSKRQVVFEFFKVMSSWRRVAKFIDDVANLKFDTHLRNFKSDDLVKAKKQIKHLHFEKL